MSLRTNERTNERVRLIYECMPECIHEIIHIWASSILLTMKLPCNIISNTVLIFSVYVYTPVRLTDAPIYRSFYPSFTATNEVLE